MQSSNILNEDTIAAISTPIGVGGIGIIRVSGSNAITIVDRLFIGRHRLVEAKSHTVHYGHIVDYKKMNGFSKMEDRTDVGHICPSPIEEADAFFIDEVLVSVFRAPHSYTTEDVVEIQCHGGIYVMQKILDVLFSNEIRPAYPGEFTKRAYFGGRIDLSQAESIMDVISAGNERMLENSQRQLSGVLSKRIMDLRKLILHEVAFIEAALDDPEHYDLSGYPMSLSDKVDDWLDNLAKLISSSSDGRMLKDGIRTVIVGKPNVGKSSLLNALSKSERAIVTDIPGTTRDTLEESVRIKDISLVVYDTAGIRDTDNAVERLGIERALRHVEEADLILYVIDASELLDENDNRILNTIDLEKTIILLNKSDKETVVSEFDLKDRSCPLVLISAKEQVGLDALYDAIVSKVFSDNILLNDDFFITNLRHKSLLEEASASLKLVMSSILDGMPEDFFSIDLMDAYARLGDILGEEVSDDLVNEIFSKFCMGK